MLVRTNARYAGGPPPGQVGEMDDDTAAMLVESGSAEDMTVLSKRVRRPRARPADAPPVKTKVPSQHDR